ncbi:hypothetical protein OnM2_099020 [Erysiphe neolycopersici]|uniref:Uncharacterized protein n=1 Tax=Erysiphe neolycopersici TaxID=212602 RepID=A0A420H9Y9_9PEZI|nr:hypothetical protein OnM2_099020 [Erysiphe neolycopersici]
MAHVYCFPSLDALITPLLASLCVAGVSSRPPCAVLPLLSPILRQRVQLLSSSSQDPWTSFLCYDDAVASKLKTLQGSPYLELHPVSGQIEIDWDSDSEIQFRRLDSETLEALVSLHTFDLTIKLIWCIYDPDGIDHDGWRIGEVGTCTLNDLVWGAKTILLAEQEFTLKENQNQKSNSRHMSRKTSIRSKIEEEKEEDDDKYWAQYDDIPAQTPADGKSPANLKNTLAGVGGDDEYYAGYDKVQPALDNHDPDKALVNGLLNNKVIQNPANLSSSLFDPIVSSLQNSGSKTWTEDSADSSVFIAKNTLPLPLSGEDGEIVSNTFAVIMPEQQALMSENAIKTHIGTSLKGLYRLAQSAGIGQGEFDRLVRTQLDLLNIMNEARDDF